MTEQYKTKELRPLTAEEIELVSGGWWFDSGEFYRAEPPIQVFANVPNLSWLNFLNAGSISLPNVPNISLPNLVNHPADPPVTGANPQNQHKPPNGYHFGDMDPSGNYYMIKDGDPNNSLVITPWYAAQIHANLENISESINELQSKSLILGAFPSAAPFAAFVTGVLEALKKGI